MISYFQAVIIGLLQGVTELFPVSSLGHSVLLPSVLGWHSLAKAQSQPESFYLAFIVGLHVATALAMLVYFRRDWARIITALARSVRDRRIEDGDQRLGWLLVVATIPAGILGLALEHTVRTLFAKPLAASLFLIVNGVILLIGERARRRSHQARTDGGGGATATSAVATRQLESLGTKAAVAIGVAQAGALFAGISRSGITMTAGLLRGLNHEDAARFSFLLATPIILAAGLYKLPDLAGPLGNGIRGQVLAGSVAAAIAAWFSVRFLTRWFRTRTLIPFAIYSLLAGAICAIRFGLF